MNGKAFMDSLSDEDLVKYAQDWSKGVRFATQIFDGVKEEEFIKLFELAKKLIQMVNVYYLMVKLVIKRRKE